MRKARKDKDRQPTGTGRALDLARAMEEARREGQALVANHAGPAGLALLRAIRGRIDTETLLQWEVVSNPPGASGDCFFTTTQALINLIETGPTKGLRLVTGLFRNPAGGTITHAWIEARAPSGRVLVLNVSNPRRSPIYVARRDDYHRTNELLRTIQDITADRLTELYLSAFPDLRSAVMLPRTHPFDLSRATDLRAFAQAVLAPSMATVA